MTKSDLINFAGDFFGCKIGIRKMVQDGRWYEQEYTSEFTDIELDQKYGVIIDSKYNTIDFDFKTGKKEDSILKTFITQFISKWLAKQPELIDGEVVYPKVSDVKKRLSNNNRVSKYQFYTTLYGIGYMCLFDSDEAIADVRKKLGGYLKSKNIDFRNEFSDARWVYRFVINKDVCVHNKLLKELEY